MSALSLTGKPVAAAIRAKTLHRMQNLQQRGVTAGMAVVVATTNDATAWYVRSIVRAAAAVGIECTVHDLGVATTEHIAHRIQRLNQDPGVHGIIVQTPLPPGTDASLLVGLIDPAKDIDGANPRSLGRLSVELPAFAPATAQAVIEVLDHYRVPLAGERVTVVGRSAVVGKPVAQLLVQRDATVTICHSRSTNIAQHTRSSSVNVVAVGRAGFFGAEHLTQGSVVIDVGTNVDENGKLVGDVDEESVAPLARALTPVPGGVGSVTTALLLLHTVQAAESLTGERLKEGALMVGQG